LYSTYDMLWFLPSSSNRESRYNYTIPLGTPEPNHGVDPPSTARLIHHHRSTLPLVGSHPTRNPMDLPIHTRSNPPSTIYHTRPHQTLYLGLIVSVGCTTIHSVHSRSDKVQCVVFGTTREGDIHT
jgi:hypothetical protein